MKRSKTTISISIDEDLLQVIDEIAFDTRMSRSAVIKTALLDAAVIYQQRQEEDEE